MSLGVRIPLILLSFFILFSGLAWTGATLRENQLEQRYAASTASDRRLLWREIVETIVAAMEDKVWIVREDARLLNALRSGGAIDIVEASRSAHGAVVAAGVAARLDILDRSARMAFSSDRPSTPSSPLAANIAARVAVGGERQRGVGNDKNGAVVVTVAYPIVFEKAVIGVGVYGRSIDEALREFAESIGGDAYIVNRRGRLLAGTDQALWTTIEDAGHVLDARSAFRLALEDRRYEVAGFPFAADVGTLIGQIVTITDVTETAQAERRLETIFVLVLFAISLSLVGIVYGLVRPTFVRLSHAVDALRNLSQPDPVVAARVSRLRGIDKAFQGRAADEQDEIGRIDDAVAVFEANQDAIARLRAARGRARERQNALIREEMTRLAATLDKEAKAELLADLAEVERSAAERGDQDDLGATALAFSKMSGRIQDQQAALNQLVAELREALETKTEFLALQRELAIGQRVQTSILPPPMPPHRGVAVRGAMRPAKEIGGDFYDHFILDDGAVGVVVADVSGKGVPASLFMAISQSLLRATVAGQRDPAAALMALNDSLVESNREELFVTLFYGVIDPETGIMNYANAGHNPPILLSDGAAHYVPTTGDLALAIMDGVDYERAEIALKAGDRLFLYTDGVTEAMNNAEEEYTDERMMALMARLKDTPDDEFLEAVVADVDDFASGAPQADDITTLLVHYMRESEDSGDTSEP